MEIYLTTKASTKIKSGFPWIYRDDIISNSALEIAENGEVVTILDNKGKKIGYGYLNYSSKISVRVLTTDIKKNLNAENFFQERIARAVDKRKKYFGAEYKYSRFVFGEADFLPGFIVDSYGEYLSCEVTTSGAYRLKDLFIVALTKEISFAKGVIISINANDRSENLKREKIIIGNIPEIVQVKENGVTYFANLKEGQKTGWFYDQRANRNYLSNLSEDKNFCDLFTHSGGFGVLAAVRGARSVLMVDSSEMALSLAKESAKYNNIRDKCDFIKADIFDFLKNYSGKKFEIVNTDPPAFIKAKKYIESGMKGYSKLVLGCMGLYDKTTGGDKVFALTSCSHHADRKALKKMVEKNLKTSYFKLLVDAGAGKDHTPHPHLAKTEYLKFLAYLF